MEGNILIKKGVVVAVILLFVSVSAIPSTGNRASFDDITPPVTTCTLNPSEPNGDNGWYVSDVEVTLNATDDISGVNVTQFRVDYGSTQTYTKPFNITVDGTHTVEYRSIDYAGNVEDWKSVEFKIDQTKPYIDLWWESPDNVHVIFTANCDDASSGIDRVEFYLNDELCFTDYIIPYEWTIVWPPLPPKYSVTGLIYDRQFDEQNVTFYALLVLINEYWPDFYFTAIAYDVAGNSDSDVGYGKVPNNVKIHLFKYLIFPNDYTGRIGLFFINAKFKEGPL